MIKTITKEQAIKFIDNEINDLNEDINKQSLDKIAKFEMIKDIIKSID